MTDQELDRLLSQAAPMARDLWLCPRPGPPPPFSAGWTA